MKTGCNTRDFSRGIQDLCNTMGKVFILVKSGDLFFYAKFLLWIGRNTRDFSHRIQDLCKYHGSLLFSFNHYDII